MSERPTLATIAAGVGVSTATVSKVVNGRPDVGADTRARVERALADHGYIPVRRKSRRSADDVVSSDTTEFLRTVLSAATDAELEVVITITVRR